MTVNDNYIKLSEGELQSFARQIVAETLKASGANIENFTGQALSVSTDGGIGSMARLKAKINGQWVTGENAQQLVNNALSKQAPTYSGQTVKEYSERFIRLYKGNGAIEQNTLVGYRGYLKNHIIPAMGEMDIQEVTADTVQEYINGKAQRLAAKTIKEHINFMASIFDGAIEDDLISKNPFRSKRLKIIGKESVTVEAYTEDEYKDFVTEVLPRLDESAQLFAGITLYTGMRRGEICALRWEDIDLENMRIHATKSIAWPCQNQGIVKEPKTKNGIRNPVIMPQLLFILKRYQRKSGYLIRGQRSKKDEPITGQALKNLYDRIEKAIKESGIDFDFKSINRRGRHTMATFMNNAELDNKTIESQIGHYDVRFTRERYMNAQAKQEEREMNKLSSYLTAL